MAGPGGLFGDIAYDEFGNPTGYAQGPEAAASPGAPWDSRPMDPEMWAETMRRLQHVLSQGVGHPLATAAANAADPLGIPSAAVGAVSPETRDAWRGMQRRDGALPQVVGGLVSAGPLARAIGAVPTAGGKLATALGLGGASDVIDQASGVEGAVGPGTAAKAALNAMPFAPTRSSAVALGAAGGGIMGGLFGPGTAEAADGGPAFAAPLTDDQKALRTKLLGRRYPTEAEKKNLDALNKQDADAAAYSTWSGDQKTAAAKAEADAKAAEAKGEKKATADAATSKAEAAFNAASDTGAWYENLGQTPWEKTWVGKHLNQTALPMILGGITGSIMGRSGAKTANAKLDQWKGVVDRGGKSAVPSERMALAAEADNFGSSVFPKGFDSGKNIAAGYALPVGMGAFEGAAVANTPTLWDRNITIEHNPERLAWEKYLEQLPPDHEGRQRVEDLLADEQRYPKTNPYKDRARNTPFSLWHTLGMAAEGATGAALGKTIAGWNGPKELGLPRTQTESLKSSVGPTVEETAAALARRQQADLTFAEKRQQLAGAQQTADAAARLEQEALKRIEAEGPPQELLDALRKGLLSASQSRAQNAGRPLPDATVSNPTPIPPSTPTGGSVPPQTSAGNPQSVVIPPGMKGSQTWAEVSDPARKWVVDQLSASKTLGMRSASSIKAPDLHDAVDPSFSVKSTQAALKRLRDILVANKIDPSTVSASRLKEMLKGVPPEMFAVPAVAGGAGLWGALDDEQMPAQFR